MFCKTGWRYSPQKVVKRSSVVMRRGHDLRLKLRLPAEIYGDGIAPGVHHDVIDAHCLQRNGSAENNQSKEVDDDQQQQHEAQVYC